MPRTKKTDSAAEPVKKKKRPTGAYCVYFTYKLKGKPDDIPQVILVGSEEQCLKHIEDYKRQTLERYRCKLYVGKANEIYGRIAELKELYGSVQE